MSPGQGLYFLTNAPFPHVFLCVFQSSFWHSAEQYLWTLHFAHVLLAIHELHPPHCLSALRCGAIVQKCATSPVAHDVRPETGSQSEYSASAWLGSRMMEMISPVGLYLCVGKEQRHRA